MQLRRISISRSAIAHQQIGEDEHLAGPAFICGNAAPDNVQLFARYRNNRAGGFAIEEALGLCGVSATACVLGVGIKTFVGVKPCPAATTRQSIRPSNGAIGVFPEQHRPPECEDREGRYAPASRVTEPSPWNATPSTISAPGHSVEGWAETSPWCQDHANRNIQRDADQIS